MSVVGPRSQSVAPLLRFRGPALLCSLLFLVCELVGRPFAAMGISDDWSYLESARVLARTGHIAYNGWATAMIGWQLYPAAWLYRLTGDYYNAPRMFVLGLAAVTVFLLQRIFVRVGVSERNASLGVLAFALEPLFMEISATFMSDIPGLFTLVLCFYCCLRAVQSTNSSGEIAWVMAGVASNAVLGTCRQIAWLGLLVFVPSTLWLLRRNRRLLVIGAACVLAGVVVVLASLRWFAHQPYSITEGLLPHVRGLGGLTHSARQIVRGLLEVPFLLLPLTLAFIPELRRQSRWFLVAIMVFGCGYAAAGAMLLRHHAVGGPFQPLLGNWVSAQGHFEPNGLLTVGPIVLGNGVLALLTFVTFLGTFGMLGLALRLRSGDRESVAPVLPVHTLSWYQIGVLTVPFTLVYLVLLIPRSMDVLLDRYMLEFAFIAAMVLLRAYQQFVRPRLPLVTPLAIVIVALYGIGSVHDTFSLFRARAEAANILLAQGVQDNFLDQGPDYDSAVELERGPTILDLRINPPSARVQGDPLLGGESCDGTAVPHGEYPHYAPHFGVSFTPVACGGATPYPSATWVRWLGRDQGLYLVRYQSIHGDHRAE